MANSSKTQKPTSAREWKGRRKVDGVEIELPSGNVALCRPLSLAELIAENLLPDSLTGMADEHVRRGQGKPPTDFKQKKSKESTGDRIDRSKMAEMFDTMDRVLPRVLIEPQIRYHKSILSHDEQGEPVYGPALSAEERDSDCLYTDEVDFQDKVYIFNWLVGGTTDLEKFRSQFGSAVDGVSAV